jgi:toxin secretion/phage lysis holin
MRGSITDCIQTVITFIGGVAGFWLGGYDGLLYALIFMVVADYLTGVIKAIYNKKLSSEVGYKGILKKVCIFIMVAIGVLIDSIIPYEGEPFRTAVIFFYISNEGISLIENLAEIGLPIPKKIVKVMEQLQKDDDEEIS